MVSDESSSSPSSSYLSRRRLLGLLGGVGAVAAGIGWFAPKLLPDPVTDTLTTSYPAPPSNYVWQPSVSDEHADKAVATLEATVEEAEALRARIDLESVESDDLRLYLRGRPSGGHLRSARNERDNRTRLFSATSGLMYAGETVGAANFALDETDADAVVERGQQIRDAADDIADSISEYRTTDIGRDLGYLYAIERQLLFARLSSHRDGVYAGGTAGTDDYDAHDIASTWGEHLRAEQRLRNAQRYREQYRSNLGDETTARRDFLLDRQETLEEQLAAYPPRHEKRAQLEAEVEQAYETPYGYTHWTLWRLCYDNDFRAFDGELGGDLLARRVVETSRSLLKRRAYDFALSELDVEPDDSGYDSGRSFRAKRWAMDQFRQGRAEYDSNFAGVVASEAASIIRGGDVGLTIGDGPAWQERLNSTLYSLVGGSMMRYLGQVIGPFRYAETR
jgi:hypothetical protein